MLSKIKWAFLAAVATFAMAIPPAEAQWAVFDVSNFLQAIQRLQAINTQLNEMRNQLSELKAQKSQLQDTYKSMTGSRGMGNLVRGSVGDYRSSDWSQAQSNSGQIAALADSIKKNAGYLSQQDLAGLSSQVRSKLVRDGDAAANNQALAQSAFTHSADQFKAISALMDNIDQAQDPKAIADLQARIQVQQASLQAQLVQAQAMAAMVEAQRQVDEQRSVQEVLHESHSYYKDND